MKKSSRRYLPWLILAGMGATILAGGAILSLYGLFFHTALLAEVAPWLLIPVRLLFPGQQLTPSLIGGADSPPPAELGWWHIALFLGFCLVALMVYLVALRVLPRYAGRRFILLSTLLLGLLYIAIPVVTSQDLYSYIIYARMPLLYHLNPLTALPQAISSDPLYPHLYWKDQPSAYGPVWLGLSGALQWLVGSQQIWLMVLGLRLLSLLSHLGATWLIWSISKQPGFGQEQPPEQRIRAVLAFAWNPLLLFEACVNAHNDVVLLLLVLVGVWFLAFWQGHPRAVQQGQAQGPLPTNPDPLPLQGREIRGGKIRFLLAIVFFALATCVKVNVGLLMPGMLLWFWLQQRDRRKGALFVLGTAALYVVIILALYAPFWDGGSLLAILQINPGTSRNINTLAEFISQFGNSLLRLSGQRNIPELLSPLENMLHMLSMGLFVLLYVACLARALWNWRKQAPTAQQLLRWMALSWLLYCGLGTPWFWPWYAVTFLGLFALVEASFTDEETRNQQRLLLALRLFSLCLLSLYNFFSWAPFVTFVAGLPGFRWSFWRGLWVWVLPLLAFLPWHKREKSSAE